MRKTFKCFNLAVVFLMLFRSVGIVATCDKACTMEEACKLRCVLAGMMDQASCKGPVLACAACCHLDVVNAAVTVATARVVLPQNTGLAYLSVFIPDSCRLSSLGLSGSFGRAGPSRPPSRQPFLAVPPQNAPPVLV